MCYDHGSLLERGSMEHPQYNPEQQHRPGVTSADAYTFAGGHGLAVYAEPHCTVTVEQMGNPLARLDAWQFKSWSREALYEWADEITRTADEHDVLYSLLIEAQTEMS